MYDSILFALINHVYEVLLACLFHRYVSIQIFGQNQ